MYKAGFGQLTVAHRRDVTTGADRLVDTHPVMEVRILSSLQVVLVTRVIGFFIDHEATTLHLD